MPKAERPDSADGLEPLEDKTEALTIRSKRTERAQRKQRKPKPPPRSLLDLPYELILEVLTLPRPSALFRLGRASKAHAALIAQDEPRLAQAVIARRYACLAKCFRLPVRIRDMRDAVDAQVFAAIQSHERQELLTIHKKPYQHIQPPDLTEVCTCLTCVLRWSALCLVVDFAHWQKNLDLGEPIPMIERGKQPGWNSDLIAANAAVVRRALRSPLWYACVLEAHLSSTTLSIRRHAANKGNKRRRFRMTADDVDAGTDVFLERSGPPTLDFPFHRDNYYMLEAFLPGRSWIAEEEAWVYVPASQHDVDIQYAASWARARAGRPPGPARAR